MVALGLVEGVDCRYGCRSRAEYEDAWRHAMWRGDDRLRIVWDDVSRAVASQVARVRHSYGTQEVAAASGCHEADRNRLWRIARGAEKMRDQ